MRTLTKFLAMAAVATSVVVVAAPSQAAEFAAYTPDAQGNYLTWTNNGAGGGTLATTAPTTVNFNYLWPGFTTSTPISATFTFSGTVANGTAAQSLGPTWIETGLGGSFDFVSNTAFTIDGKTYAAGTDLLHGVFSNSWIQGATDSGSVNGSTSISGGSVDYTSDVIAGLDSAGSPRTFALTLLDVTPGFSASPGQALDSFNAAATGNFGIGGMGGVPEPATWGLMLVGFGGAGAMIRRRRAVAAVA
jgi:hypothetical protein